MTANTTPDYADRNWLTYAEEMELAKQEREWLDDNELCWEELND